MMDVFTMMASSMAASLPPAAAATQAAAAAAAAPSPPLSLPTAAAAAITPTLPGSSSNGESDALLRCLQHKWASRLLRLGGDLRSFRRVLAARSLLLPPEKDEASWLRLAGVCRRQGHLTLCANVLRRLGAAVRLMGSFGWLIDGGEGSGVV